MFSSELYRRQGFGQTSPHRFIWTENPNEEDDHSRCSWSSEDQQRSQTAKRQDFLIEFSDIVLCSGLELSASAAPF